MKRMNDVTNDMTDEIVQRERNNNNATLQLLNILVISSKLK